MARSCAAGPSLGWWTRWCPKYFPNKNTIEVLPSWLFNMVNVYITMERSTILNGKTHYELPFLIAMLNYQRVFNMGFTVVSWDLIIFYSDSMGYEWNIASGKESVCW